MENIIVAEGLRKEYDGFALRMSPSGSPAEPSWG